MKPISSCLLLLVSLILIFPGITPAKAQGGSKSGSAEFTCVTWKNLPYSELFYRDGKSFLPLELFIGKRSMAYPLKNGTILELYTTAKDEKGQQSYKLLGKKPFLEGTKQMLFFIEEDSRDKELPLRLFGLDDSAISFPKGSFRLINFTKSPLQVKLGNSVKSLKPSGMTLMRSGVSKSGGLIPFFIKSKNEIVYENRIFAQPDFREMILILPKANEKDRLKIKFITQIVASKKQ